VFYNFLLPWATEFTFLNVFRYITFRSVAALITALLISIIIGPMFIRWLKRVKFGQPIHEDVAAHKSKAGTPTMGGLLIIFSLSVSALLWADLTNYYIWLSLFIFWGFGAIGFADDYLKVRRNNNKGISARVKIGWQILIATIAILLLLQDESFSTILSIPFFKAYKPDLGIFYIPFAIIVIVGASNGVNLTDGLDGLAIGPAIVAASVFAVFCYVAGHAIFSSYLLITFMPKVGEVTILCTALAGAGLGFLWYNAYPAQMFMGDVGSLSVGGILGFLAVLCKQELLLAVVGGMFVIESLSVILQVGYFKWSGGKRIFKMAPLHHHFELKGIPESKIIIRFWITSILLGLFALSVLKLR